LSILMLAKIRDILIISTPEDLPRFKDLFGSSYAGVRFSYAEQVQPNGIAETFIIGEEFIGDDSVCLILGDNVFYGHGLTEMLIDAKKIVENEGGALVFGYYVNDPQRYGVVEFDKNGNVLSVEEKPRNPKSNYAVTGLYFYDNNVVNIAKNIKPSWRRELEITDVNKVYLEEKKLKVKLLGRGFAWLDTGTHESLIDASRFIQTVEVRQGLKIGCIEEIAYLNGWIDKKQLKKLAKPLLKSGYGEYLLKVIS
ncbi:MAG: glucose-1-phosphate thymidylyltransferase RfbA, partial [Candidatus Marinimicrobia bacterium]|nr:glucose-1-phosphate thymidylyltransferase RfbA [Candidatus Neomarinimicrobiota bacterium]